MLRYAMLMLLIALAGCDRITGAADQKVSDAEAMGYACRVSLEKPEDCMKENDGQSQTSILAGWKAADKDIQDKVLDPTMGIRTAPTPSEAAKAAPEQPKAKKTAKPN
jgi:hypothetical protein